MNASAKRWPLDIPRTDEDTAILVGLKLASALHDNLETERSDADLMWAVEETRNRCVHLKPANYPHWCMALSLMRGEYALWGNWGWPHGELG